MGDVYAMRRFRQLTRADRLKIDALERAGVSRRVIAEQAAIADGGK